MEKRLEHMKEMIAACIENQMSHLESVDTKELGEAIDMIKDLEEACYYMTITKAMKEKEEHSEKYYYPIMPYRERDMDRDMGKMYYENPNYTGGNDSKRMYGDGSSNGSNSQMEYTMMRDAKEGRSPQSRKMYMESKELHHDKATQMRELENYMQELTQDVVEMVEGATAEEKQYLSKRVAALANKLAQLND